MSFEGYREDRRGNWFGGGTQMIYINESTYQVGKEPEIYLVNEQEKHLIRIRDEKQIELMYNCMYGSQVKQEVIDWLINKAKFKYYDSVDEYIASNNNV